MDFAQLHQKQLDYFRTGKTRDYQFRIDALNKLENFIIRNEKAICQALHDDLRKPRMEGFTGEVAVTVEEIRILKKNLKNWMQPQKVGATLPLFPSKNFRLSVPKGVVLAIAPWNYPFQLLMAPVAGAIAAGNCVVAKPSELSPNTAKLIKEMLDGLFDSNYIAAVEGGVPETTELLKQAFDHIIFTGSTNVGRIVMRAAAENLTPVTLELGGKSPCIVTENADLDLAARRLVWGKYYNTGQTCIAPDYLYVHQKVKASLIEKLKVEITKQFGADLKATPDLGRIINHRNFDRIANMIDPSKVIFGGEVESETKFIAPTLMDNVTWDDTVMGEEIFGPILPIMEFTALHDTITFINTKPKPLAAYFFSNSSREQKKFYEELEFGGATINDTLLHIANPYMPFGGVGDSGMGGYHGHFSFETFSHQKSIMKRYSYLDLPARYAPYSEGKLNLLRRFLGI